MTKLPRRWLSEEEQKLWRAFLGANFRLNKAINDDLENNAGFDVLTYEILVRLSESSNHSLRMTELATCVSANKSSLTYRVSQLEKDGWVQRKECQEDGRGAWCVLTDEGFSVLKNAAPSHVQTVLDNFIESLSDQDIGDLIELFNSIAPED